ncbi:polyketide cyclase/dehydrase and lipid transport [Mycolicibacterium neworleansense]|uniref:Polyketide cyclase/dehydrase and lipid transport n=1 Tax=Mycolicibacterium neworleansense TaxID=146018 RepID=A0A0H5RQ02_9MYCO|nr:polyketide cyclase/dehydrase and lipid transport [Mycolicibacterium neworleansense]
MVAPAGLLESAFVTVLEFSDSVVVAIDPDSAYALVSDVSRMGEWSPVCKSCWWDDPAAGAVAGAWFTGRNVTPERTWDTRSQVVVADPGRQFTWEVNDGWVRWGFHLEPAEGGTRVTQAWTFLPKGIAGFRDRFGERADDEIAARSEAALTGIPETLAAIKRTAEAG